ncbi:hypothetical protein CsSME_00050437 [Camellia sinensis var. sinensis]
MFSIFCPWKIVIYLFRQQIFRRARTPFFQAPCLSDRPANTTAVSYPAVCGWKTPPTVKLAHTQG